MNFPQVQIHSKTAKLGLTIKNAQLSIEQPKAKQTIEQPKADLSIKQHAPKLSIDQSNAWSNLSLKSIFERTRDTAQHSKQLLLRNLGKMAREGDELMRIENGGNAIAAQAARNSGWNFDYKPGGMPAYKLVSLKFEPGQAEIEVKNNKPIIQNTPREPFFQYQRGKVTSKIEKYSDVQIDVKGLKYHGTQGFEITI